MNDLASCVRALGAMPGMGRSRDELKPGWRSILCRSHLFLYVEHADKVEVLRIVHGSQDIDAIAES